MPGSSVSRIILVLPKTNSDSDLRAYEAHCRIITRFLSSEPVTVTTVREQAELPTAATADVVVFLSKCELETAQTLKKTHPSIRVVIFTLLGTGTPDISVDSCGIVIASKNGERATIRTAILGGS